jgi:hypothetical protein
VRRLSFAVWVIAAITGSCHKTRTFSLPDRPAKASVAFVVLYDGERPHEVGPVVPYTRLYTGAYSVESGETGLDARLFFVEEAALAEEALARCADVADPVRRIACRDRVADCTRDAPSCLLPKIRGEGCGDRLALSSALDLTEFRADDGGDLDPVPSDSSSAGDLELCGPSLEFACPILLPGFLVTENNRYRCTALSRQRGCTLEVDLSSCGLGRAIGVVGADGTFTPVVEIEGCTGDVLSSEDRTVGGGSGFAVRCEERRFVASYMQRFFGDAQCARRGPTIYNNPLADFGFVPQGFVRGAKFLKLPLWSSRLLFDGTGVDGCALNGCGNAGHCGDCDQECLELIELPDCANANPWDACTGRDTAVECLARCHARCATAEASCSSLESGHGLSIAALDEPESALEKHELDGSASIGTPVSGVGSIALFNFTSDRKMIAVAGRQEVRLFNPLGADTLEPLPTLVPDLGDFEIAGITDLPNRTGKLLLYGRTLTTGTALLLEVLGGQPNEAELAYGAPITLSVPTADAAAVFGANAELVAVASLDPPLSESTPDVAQLAIVLADGTGTRDTLRMGGKVTALGSMIGGAALAGVVKDSGEVTLEVVVAGGSGAQVATTLAVPRGLIPKVIQADPELCASAGEACRTYVGFVLDGANRENGRAIVGIVEHARDNAAGAALIPSFVVTASPELTIIEIDTDNDVLYAIASASNRVTPIQLAR